jgi:hypothetical protein
MKLRLLILLAAAALAAAPAAGQTIKSLGYNTTNGQIVYSGTNALTFTNALQFATNARAATRTNLGGTTLGNAVFTATNAAAAQVAIFGTNADINNSSGLTGISLSDGQTKLLSGISFPFLGGATAAATSRTNLGLGAADNVTFSNITANGILNANDSTATPATNAAAAQGIQWSGLGGSQHAAIYGGYPGAAQIALAVGASSNALSDVATFRATGMTVASNAVVGGTLAVSNAATFATNVTVNGSLSVGSFTTTTPSTWALDATQTAAATNGRLTLPSNANVIRLTNNNAISSVTNGVLGAFYYLVNQATNAVTISNVGGITIDGAQNLTLSPNESATLVATGPTNVSVANRGDLTDVALGGTANTAPSQTASSGSSLMTRDLSDARYLPMPPLTHWAPLLATPIEVFTNNSGTIDVGLAAIYATTTGDANSSVSAIFSGPSFTVIDDTLYPLDGAGNGVVFRGQLTPDGTNRLARFLFSSAASRSAFNTVITNYGTNGITANGWAVETRQLTSGVKEMRLIVYGATNITESAWTTMASGSRYNQIIAVVPSASSTKLYYTNGFGVRLGTNAAITVSNTPAGAKSGTAGAFGVALVNTNTTSGGGDLFVKDIYQIVAADQFGF